MTTIELYDRAEIRVNTEVSSGVLALKVYLNGDEQVLADSGDHVSEPRFVADKGAETVIVKVYDGNDATVNVYTLGESTAWAKTTSSPLYSYRIFTIPGTEDYQVVEPIYVKHVSNTAVLPKSQIIIIKRRDVP